MKQLKNKLLKGLKFIAIAGGCLFFVLLVLAFTSVPFHMHHSLGKDPNRTKELFEPEYIVMLGGAGMPSQGNLIRLFYTAEFAKNFNAKVIVLHPKDSLCHVEMQKDLIAKGVDSINIMFLADKGSNTYLQVSALKEEQPGLLDKNILVITSPEHLTRTVKCFNKAGFKYVRGKGAFEATVDFNLSLKGKKLKGNKYVPSVESTNLRYTFWNYLKLEIECFREYIAIIYYKMKGWI